MIQELIQKRKNIPYATKGTSKAADTGDRRVKGLANAYNYIDADGDMLVKGACAKSIQERGANSKAGNKIKQLWQHDWSKPSARIDVLEERMVEYEGKAYEGLYHESYYPDTDTGNEVYKMIQEGVIDGRSIGFRYEKVDYAKADTDNDEWKRNFDEYAKICQNPDEIERRGEFYVVKEIQLFEISDVSLAANPFTFTLGKSADAQTLHEKIRKKQTLLLSEMRKRTNANPDSLRILEMELRQLFTMWENAVKAESQPSKIDTATPSEPSDDTPKRKGANVFLFNLK